MCVGNARGPAGRWLRRVIIAVVVGSAACGAGCLRVESAIGLPGVASVADGESIVDIATARAQWRNPATWPARIDVRSGLTRANVAERSDGPGVTNKPMGVIREVRGPISLMRRGDVAQKVIDQELAEDVSLLMARRRGKIMATRVTAVGEGRGSFVCMTSDEPGADAVWDGPAGKPLMYLKFVSGRTADAGFSDEFTWVAKGDGVSPGDDEGAVVELPARGGNNNRVFVERTWFALYSAKLNAGQQPKGLLVLMPGIFGTPKGVIEDFIGSLRGRGYMVLRMLAHPSRFTERVSFTIATDLDLEAQARRVAEVFTDRAAETAYAVQAAMMYVRQQRPEVRSMPAVLMGMSGGGVVLPTVLARDPGRFCGAVVVAGGADSLRLAWKSSYREMIDAVRFTWLRPRAGGPSGLAYRDGLEALTGLGDKAGRYESYTPTERELDAFAELYHRHAPLDGVRTGPALAGLPSLFVVASDDTAVPAPTSDRLWSLAGKPERWVIGGGHELLFLTFNWHASKLIDWIDSVVIKAGTPGSAAR